MAPLGLSGSIQVRLWSPRPATCKVQDWSLPCYFVSMYSPTVAQATGGEPGVAIHPRIAKLMDIRKGDTITADIVEGKHRCELLIVEFVGQINADLIINGAANLGVCRAFDMSKEGEFVTFPNGRVVENPRQFLWAGLRAVLPFRKTVVLHFDGGSRNNPEGPAGYGYVLELASSNRGNIDHHNKTLVRGYGYYPKGTSNEMEYHGLIEALTWAIRLEIQQLIIRGDSELVIYQCLGDYQVNADNLKPLHAAVSILLAKAKQQGTTCLLEHVPRSQNQTADFLCQMGIDARSHGTFCNWTNLYRLKARDGSGGGNRR